MHDDGEIGRQGEGQRRHGQVVGQPLRSEPPLAQIDENRTGGQAEHGDTDDEERQVVPGRHGNDSGLDDLQHQRRRGHEAESHIEADPSAGFVSRFQLMHATCHGYYAERPEFGVNASIRQRYAEARGARELTTPGTRGFPLDIRASRIA